MTTTANEVFDIVFATLPLNSTHFYFNESTNWEKITGVRAVGSGGVGVFAGRSENVVVLSAAVGSNPRNTGIVAGVSVVIFAIVASALFALFVYRSREKDKDTFDYPQANDLTIPRKKIVKVL